MNINTYRIKNQHKTSRRRTWLFILLGGLLLIAAIYGFLAITHAGNIIGTKPSKTQTANQSTKGEPANSSNGNTSSNGNNNSDGNTTGDDKQNGSTGTQDSAAAAAPSGNFVSNYAPSLSATGAKEQIQSVCNTTPGATCTISFSKDGTTKSLEKRVTDKGGSSYWTWTLKDIGLTAGNWKITATAELNGHQTSTTDTLPLEVQP
jgi:hypothetical protein